MAINMSFGNWLRQRRRSLDLTQADLARQIGCSEITIRKIESDERTPSRQIAELLARFLGIPEREIAPFLSFARGRQGEVTSHETPLSTSTPNTPITYPITGLIGRSADLNALEQRLIEQRTRLLTVIGPPGIGKTRLALEAINQLRTQFRDGAVFVALAPLTHADLVISAIAQALHVNEISENQLFDLLCDALQSRQMLLVLDNCEHVLEAAPLIVQLLGRCPQVQVLATSRAALDVHGEQLFPLAPLALPNLAWPLAATQIAESPAVALFVERAQAVTPNFQLLTSNAATIAAICTRLDGLPLAIELVAARTRLLAPVALLARLGQGLALTVDGPRDLPLRHRTLNSAIQWSYDLLSQPEQQLFSNLGIFVGSWTLELAEQIAWQANPDAPDFLEVLDSLVAKSLVQRLESDSETPRFVLLETIREYALTKLTNSGHMPIIAEHHAQVLRDLAEQAEPELHGAEQEHWLDTLEAEHHHFRAALEWTTRAANYALGLQLAAALWRFWYIRCHLSEGRRWLTAMLSNTPNDDQSARVRALLGAAVLVRAQGDDAQALSLLETCIIAARRTNQPSILASALYNQGVVLYEQGHVAEAISLLEESLVIQRLLNDQIGVASTLNGLGNVLLGQDDQRAIRLFRESIALQRALGNQRGLAFTLHSLGFAMIMQCSYAEGQGYFSEALGIFDDLEDKIGIADCLAGLAAMAGGLRQASRAGRLWLAAEALRATINAPLSNADRAIYEAALANVPSEYWQTSNSSAPTLSVALSEGRNFMQE